MKSSLLNKWKVLINGKIAKKSVRSTDKKNGIGMFKRDEKDKIRIAEIKALYCIGAMGGLSWKFRFNKEN